MASSVFTMQEQGEMSAPLHRPVCLPLQAHRANMASVPMRDLFAADPARYERFSLQVGEPPTELEGHRDILTANFLAQTEALMRGRTREETQREAGAIQAGQFIQHKLLDGNHPGNAILRMRYPR